MPSLEQNGKFQGEVLHFTGIFEWPLCPAVLSRARRISQSYLKRNVILFLNFNSQTCV